MQKKIIAFVITVAFLFTLIPSTSLASLSYLSDIDEHWAEPYIQTLFNMGITKGDSENFNPEKSITRGEFISLISRSIYNLSNYTPQKYFNDVTASHMFFGEISIAKENNIIIGKNSGFLGVKDNITREEAVIIISRIFENHTPSKNYTFSDISNNYLYKAELDRAVDLGIIEGKTNGKFEPYSNLKRSESAKIILKILEIYGKSDDANTVLSVAKNYFSNEQSSVAISRESEEKAFEQKYISYAKSLGVTVEKNISNANFNIINLTNNTAQVEINFDVAFTTKYSDQSQKTKEYAGREKMYLLRKNNEWKVYYTNENYFLKDKVNLTWEVFINPPSYAPDGVNVISPTWYELISDDSYANSNLVYSDSTLKLKLTDKSNKKYIDFAKQNGYDLWIAYRNDFNKANTEKFLKNSFARENALKLVIAGVLNSKAEGINLDFENMTNKYDYSNHVREVTLASHALGLITSVDITKYDKTSLSWSMCFDRDYIGEICDYTALMAYDQYGTHSTTSGPVASFSWVEESIKTTLGEVESKKLILGVPFYVRHWQEKNGKVVKTSAISMERAKQIANENNAAISEKDGQYVAKWTKDGYNYTIYMEDAYSISNKLSLINKYNLAGIASWRRGFETSDIWQVIKSHLN